MYCTRCGVELDEKSVNCARCAAHPKLALDKQNKKIAGVCAGFARYFGVEVLLVRIVWLALVLGAGVGIIGYVIAWALMPVA
jgi:phage shock protein C